MAAPTSDMVDMDDTFRVTSLGEEQPRELPREMLVEIIEPRMQEILQMVREEVIKSGYIEMLPAGAVLTGGGALMPGTVQLAEKILGMPTRMGQPQGVGGLNDTVQSPVCATGGGAGDLRGKGPCGPARGREERRNHPGRDRPVQTLAVIAR